MTADYDLIVIGSGPAGEKGAAQAAYFNKRVALVEREAYLGGTGINTGTIPSKTLRETSLYFSGLRQRGLYGIDYSLKEGMTARDFLYRERTVVDSQRAQVEWNLARHGVEVVHGQASLLDPHTVRVRRADGTEVTLQAGVILIATGSSPLHPAGVPFEIGSVRDSDSILHVQRIPQSVVIVGGGVIGCEYAALFAALGVVTTVALHGTRLLGFVDGEIAGRLQQHLEDLGVQFRFGMRIETVTGDSEAVRLRLEGGELLSASIALYAIGRQSNVEGLGLEALGVELGPRGVIVVNERFQTTVPNIYAAGDVIGFPSLASAAMEQARVAMVHAFDLRYKEAVSPVLPLAIYTIPEIAMVGLTEDACREQQIPYLVGRARYDQNARGQIIGDKTGMLKLIFSPHDKRLLGVHQIGELASELIHLGAQVLASAGTIDAFIEASYNYPSLSEAYKYAAYDGLGAWQRWLAEPTS